MIDEVMVEERAAAFTKREAKFSSKLRAGVVSANTFNKFDPTSPFRRLQGKRLGREGGVQRIEPS